MTPLTLTVRKFQGAGKTPALLLPSPPGTPHHLEHSLDSRHRILVQERYSDQLFCGSFEHPQISGEEGKKKSK